MPTHEAKKVVETWVGASGRALLFRAMKDGSAFDLTGKTVTLKATYNGSTKISDAACTVTDAAAGDFEYTPDASEIDEAGDYDAQAKVSDGSDPDFLEVVILRVKAVV